MNKNSNFSIDKIYQVYENNCVIFEHNVFDYAYHEMLSFILNSNNDKYLNNSYYIKEKLNIPFKKYDIITNIITFDVESDNYCIKTKEKSDITINIIKSHIIELIEQINSIQIIIKKKNIKKSNVIIRDDNNNKNDLIIDDNGDISENKINNTQDNNIEVINNENNLTKEEKIKQIQDMIKKMELVKNKKLKIIEERKIKNEEEKDKIADENLKIQKKKLFERSVKDKIKELKNIYNSDVNVYYKIRDDIENNPNTVPPLLLRSKYPIFKFMDENNILDHENSYIIFKKIYYTFYEKESEARNYYGDYVFELNEDEENIYVNDFADYDDKINGFIDYLSTKIIDIEKLIDEKFSGDTIKNSINFG